MDANSYAAALILLILTTVDGNTLNTDDTVSHNVRSGVCVGNGIRGRGAGNTPRFRVTMRMDG